MKNIFWLCLSIFLGYQMITSFQKDNNFGMGVFWAGTMVTATIARKKDLEASK